MKTSILNLAFLIAVSLSMYSQTDTNKDLIFNSGNPENINVFSTAETYSGKKALKVTDQGGNTEVRFVKLPGIGFASGVIEVDLAGKPATGAFAGARGFVGIAFRINDNNSAFECIYLRPTNGRANDQLRRNHSVQYISYPDLPWYKSRKATPGKYETYVDLVPGEWTHIRIVVKGEQAMLYVHGNEQPTLIVNDLHLGPDQKGGIGLWIGPGTEAWFANLKVLKDQQ